MDFKYIINEKNYQDGVVKYWGYSTHIRIISYFVVWTFFGSQIIFHMIPGLIGISAYMIDKILLIVFLFSTIIVSSVIYSVFKRREKKSIGEHMRFYEFIVGDRDSLTVVLSYDERYLYVELNEQKNKYELKDFFIVDTGTAYCICMSKRGFINGNAFVVIPKKMENSNPDDEKYTEELEHFIHTIIKKMRRKKVLRGHKKSETSLF